MPERFFVTLTIDNCRVRFEVMANSMQNPIHLRELRSFPVQKNCTNAELVFQGSAGASFF